MSTYVNASGRTARQVPTVANFPSASSTQAQPTFARPNRTGSAAAPFPTGPGWVVHIPVVVADLPAALALADRVATLLGMWPEVQAGAMEVSPEDEQSRRVRVICDRRLGGRARCGLRYGHEEECRDMQAHIPGGVPLPVRKRRAS